MQGLNRSHLDTVPVGFYAGSPCGFITNTWGVEDEEKKEEKTKRKKEDHVKPILWHTLNNIPVWKKIAHEK